MTHLCSGDCGALSPREDSSSAGQDKVSGSLRADPGSVPLPAEVRIPFLLYASFSFQDSVTSFSSSSPVFTLSVHVGIKSPWTPPRLCFCWWQRRACPACPPAWERCIPASETPTASSTSPMRHRRCLEPQWQQTGRRAERDPQSTPDVVWVYLMNSFGHSTTHISPHLKSPDVVGAGLDQLLEEVFVWDVWLLD